MNWDKLLVDLPGRSIGILIGISAGWLLGWLYLRWKRRQERLSVMCGDARETIVIQQHIVERGTCADGTHYPKSLRIRSLGQSPLRVVVPNNHLSGVLLHRAHCVTARHTLIGMEGSEGSYLLETLTNFVCDRVANEPFDHDLYVEARAVWEMVEFALNGVIFILIGLQLPVILKSLSGTYTLEEILVATAAISAVVIVARIVWVFPGAYLPRWLDRKVYGVGDPYPPWQNVAVVSWTGMRGVVSLAAALAIPVAQKDGTPFPHRDVIQLVTFGVIFATLVGQGMTLPLLIRWLKVDALADAEREDDDADEVGA